MVLSEECVVFCKSLLKFLHGCPSPLIASVTLTNGVAGMAELMVPVTGKVTEQRREVNL